MAIGRVTKKKEVMWIAMETIVKESNMAYGFTTLKRVVLCENKDLKMVIYPANPLLTFQITPNNQNVITK